MEKEVSSATVIGVAAVGVAAIAGLTVGIIAICKKAKAAKEAKYIHLN